MKKIFITGGAGYVGAVTVPHLLNLGYEITVLDLFIYGENVLSDHPKLTIIKGDIRNQTLLNKIIPGHDAVIHMACISNDPSFELNPQLGKSINFDAFRPLVEISENNGIKRFIYVSSSSVYGIKYELNVTEDMDLLPITDYSKYKAECEKILAEYQSSNFTTVTIRPATVCGYSPRQRLDVVVNILTNLAYNKREISVYGGIQLRPNIHIEDIKIVYSLLLEASKSKIQGEVFNVGGKNLTVQEIAETVKKIIGNDVNIIFEDSDDLRSYHISSEKIYNKLGFKTRLTIEDAVKDILNAFKKGLLPDSLIDKKYFNIKTMKSISI